MLIKYGSIKRCLPFSAAKVRYFFYITKGMNNKKAIPIELKWLLIIS
jgi:hypothetical protein